MTRLDGRANDELRPITFERDYTEMAAGSVLVTFGKTRVLCTASIDENVPRWMKNSGKGWVTAEYSMLPGASPERIDREAAKGKQSGRTVEIQRLIGRSLRAACDMRAARRAPGRRRLRCAAGRRRNPHRQHLRRLPRAARRAGPAGAEQGDRATPTALVLRGDQRRHRRGRADARPSVRRGFDGRGRHERGDARQAKAASRCSSRCRARPRARRSRGASSTCCCGWPRAGCRRSWRCRPRWSRFRQHLVRSVGDDGAIATRVRIGQSRQGRRDRGDPRRVSSTCCRARPTYPTLSRTPTR